MAKRFIQYFEDSFKENWDLPAMTNYVTKQTYAYKDVAREVAKLHILFRELNIQQNDKIALVGSNTPEWAITFLATVTYGAVIVPILQDFHPDDIAHIIEHSESKLLFIEDSSWDRLEGKDCFCLRVVFSLSDFHCIQALNGESVIGIHRLHSLFINEYPNDIQRECINYLSKEDSEMCVLIYTSGTSTASRGVMLTGENYYSILEYSKKKELGFKGSRILSYLPLSHAYGCTFDFLCQMVTGGHVTMLPKITSPSDLMTAMQEVKPSLIAVVPMILEGLYRKQIAPVLKKPHMRILTSLPFVSSYIYAKIRRNLIEVFGGSFTKLFVGGAPFDPKVEDFFAKIKFPFAVAYGMTECSPLISVDFESYTPYSVGKAIDGVVVTIDSDSPSSIPGEILVKGKNVMKGYYKDAEATSRSFNQDGMLKTGDLGIIDKNGNIFIKGRAKSMILSSSGQNVYPEGIEAKLVNDIHIKECVVVQRNHNIVALVYPDYSVVDKGITQVELSQIMENCRIQINKELASFEYISEFIIQDKEFEKTPKKNIKRYLYN